MAKIEYDRALMDIPTPDKIIAARKAAGLTQTEAATLIYAGLRTWQHWEGGDRKMRPSDWESFLNKIGEISRRD